MIFYCNATSIFEAAFKNGDTEANPLFFGYFDLQKNIID